MGKIILTYGTFDLFHIGHLKILQNAKKYGDKLIVGISTDEFNKKKGKKTIIPFEQRKEIVENIRCVDIVIGENSWEQKIEDIEKYSVDIFVMGDDWKNEFDNLKDYCEVKYLPRTKGISSTQLKSVLNKVSVSKNELLQAFDILERLKQDFA